ncbi:BREX system P-loop protein BrxC [Siculibacillus lacustris]|uniref:BREX system P-loop protein BrxC n=1 Tax=Siculibacillus lacustris TaxID=1549641 RepID=A0A4Q9VDZ5_9HYPH|nr:BREX system P-loop protein BrxC [Siculibacillus lacustris]TBW32926.1 BREX system P-loop protein BrxC [Siculibacillus lacustris]
MTSLREIFKRPIDRPIEGVIKADDEVGLRLEIEEYVLTNEIERNLGRFLNAYNDYTNANGVWISGFFGSGKSHLLKMLAYVLENRDVDGTPAFDLFVKGGLGDAVLKADLEKAIRIPSKSILFNIDQKSDIIAKTQIDALLSVFQKVFDEMCGYYGKQSYIARFERDLEGRGELTAFKVEYEKIAGRPWERGREQAPLEGSNIDKAYAAATGASDDDVKDVLRRYRSEMRQSIEGFAADVRAWLDTQKPGFRLNFFVDEVGQYIADNTKLMTNLQTIAESLATKCRGQAWIIVTAQQEMKSVIGDMTQSQHNDFSKIQARFANRIPLNSQDVAEVIQRRLLEKTADGRLALIDLYHDNQSNFGTLLDFTDGGRRYTHFKDSDAFIASYPFVPYEYELFQDAIKSLSEHNAFEGRHSSVGERSMLGVFQSVAVANATSEVGKLATFDQMFDAISAVLKGNVQSAVASAKQDNLVDEFALRVLKALFLVKYVKTFRPTVHNVGILLLDRLDADLTNHRRKVEEALALLEQQIYIQRNGDAYEFLTDEEKDVEEEIKSVDIDSTEFMVAVKEVLFGVGFKNNIKHANSGQDFQYSSKVDNQLFGREYAVGINMLTEYEIVGDLNAVAARSVACDDLLVVIPQDSRFNSDVKLYKQTLKYLQQASDSNIKDSVKRIREDRARQNNDRLQDIKTRASQLVGSARFFARGSEIEVKGSDAAVRVDTAFQTLVDKVYTSLSLLRSVTYTDAQIAEFAKKQPTVFDTELTEAEREIIAYAQTIASEGNRTYARGIVEHFTGKPYGWEPTAILCLTAGLVARRKLQASLSGSPVEGDRLVKALKSREERSTLFFDIQTEFTPAQVRDLKTFMATFFDGQPTSNDGKALGEEAKAKFEKLVIELAGYIRQPATYPFMVTLTSLGEKTTQISKKPPDWLLTEFADTEKDDLLALKEENLDRVRTFLSGSQKIIFDSAWTLMANESSNLLYVNQDDVKKLEERLLDPNCLNSNGIRDIKNYSDKIREKLFVIIAEERKAATDAINQKSQSLFDDKAFATIPEARKTEVRALVAKELTIVKDEKLIAVIRNRVTHFNDEVFPRITETVLASVPIEEPPAPLAPPIKSDVVATPPDGEGKAEPPKAKGLGGGDTLVITPPLVPRPPKMVAISRIKPSISKPYLSDESDVDLYVDELRRSLMVEIAAGKRISL